MKKLEIKKSYRSEGFVLGNYWGGGQGAYPCTKFESDNLDDLIKQNELALKSGSLDSGMGYESLIGARLWIVTISKIMYEGQEYINTEYDDQFIGELTSDEQDFLLDCY
jgi:hypothetical protein